MKWLPDNWLKRSKRPDPEEHLPPQTDEDPFDQPVVLEITDVIDLHSIRPAESRAVVEEYLFQARKRRFRHLRIIHGKGIGVQREMVRTLLARTPFVESFGDAPPESGGLGATIVTLSLDDNQSATGLLPVPEESD